KDAKEIAGRWLWTVQSHFMRARRVQDCWSVLATRPPLQLATHGRTIWTWRPASTGCRAGLISPCSVASARGRDYEPFFRTKTLALVSALSSRTSSGVSAKAASASRVQGVHLR